jgi:uncharacterized protein (TIGR03083 family)
VETRALLSSLASDGAAFATAARKGLDTPVPSCPEWTLEDLLVHLGTVHAWQRTILSERPPERIPFPPPPPADDRIAWFETNLSQLVDVATRTDADEPMWSWAPPHQARFWIRRAAQETAVHRWDAEGAHGGAAPIDAEVAADGIQELFDVFMPRLDRRTPVKGAAGQTLHVHCTDVAGEWIIRFAAAGTEIERGHAKADGAVRGAASDLLILLWGREPTGPVEVIGDPSLVGMWRGGIRL